MSVVDKRPGPGALVVLCLAALNLVGMAAAFGGEKEKKERRGGTVIGTVTATKKAYLEVKADGEEKARGYVPHWRGGLPAQGGGPDREMVQKISEVKVGSRVRIEWEFEERPRVVKIDVLKAAGGKSKEKREGKKEGAREESTEQTRRVIGSLVGRGTNFVEVKADGDEKARKYFLHKGGTTKLVKAMRETPIGTRVEVEWFFLEAPRVVSLQPLGKKEN